MNRRVAVVGSGISGLGAAYALRDDARVTLFEADTRFGGHAHTVDVTLEGITHGVDTGFLVYNERTYPKLIQLLAELGVETALSDMSFSVQVPGPVRPDGRRGRNTLEWNGSTTSSVFAQRSNLFKPRFWRMIRDILRFNREATAIAERNAESELQEPIGEHLQRRAYSDEFRDWYLLPMIGCIWSCPTDQMLRFPIATLIRFCHNHGLIQVEGRPRWHTVRGGSRHYVEKVLTHIPDARAGTPVRRVLRLPEGGVEVHTDAGAERFDAVVMAGHSDQSLSLLEAPTPEEAAVLGAIRYHDNRAVLHTDASVLPERRLAWASWNYERAADAPREQAAVCLHYLLNKLQPLPWHTPTVVSLNPVREIDPAHVIRTLDYAHPVFDAAAVEAQKRLPAINGHGGVWLCGAWTRYGFHEDGLMSGQAAAEGLRRQWSGAEARSGAAA